MPNNSLKKFLIQNGGAAHKRAAPPFCIRQYVPDVVVRDKVQLKKPSDNAVSLTGDEVYLDMRLVAIFN